MSQERFIVHVDMDAFFASVEQRDSPLLKGRPVIVGADPKNGKGRGVVSTCSYEARVYGVHSAMPISIAYRLCPGAVYLPVDMERYQIASEKISEILYSFTPDIEHVGIDEAFLDITGSHHLFGGPLDTCISIKSKIKEKLSLTASIGIAPTKMAAKIASDLKKPDGLVEVKIDALLDFLWPLSVSKLWGVGEKTKDSLNALGINTIGELARADLRKLIDALGNSASDLWQLANGVDTREVEVSHDSKSISNETTFEEDSLDKEKVTQAIMMLSEEVSDRLRENNFKARTISVKIRLRGFHTYTRSLTINEPTNFFESISATAKSLFDNFEFKDRPVRLIGVKASNLQPADFRESLFEEKKDLKIKDIQNVVGHIKDKFGNSAISRAAGLTRRG